MSDLFSDTVRQILDKLVNGEFIGIKDLEEMVQGRGKASLRSKIMDLNEALKGNVKKYHTIMLEYHYEHLKFLEKQMKEIEDQIEQYVKPYSEEVAILDSVPSINEKAATMIIAEMGLDTDVFPSDKHLASWAGVYPGNNESAGKKKKQIKKR